ITPCCAGLAGWTGRCMAMLRCAGGSSGCWRRRTRSARSRRRPGWPSSPPGARCSPPICGRRKRLGATEWRSARNGPARNGNERSVVAWLVDRLQHVLRQGERALVDRRVVVAGDDATADEALIQRLQRQRAVVAVGAAPGEGHAAADVSRDRGHVEVPVGE